MACRAVLGYVQWGWVYCTVQRVCIVDGVGLGAGAVISYSQYAGSGTDLSEVSPVHGSRVREGLGGVQLLTGGRKGGGRRRLSYCKGGSDAEQ